MASRVLKNSKMNPSNDLDDGEAADNAVMRAATTALALEAKSDGSEFADRQSAKAALKRGLEA